MNTLYSLSKISIFILLGTSITLNSAWADKKVSITSDEQVQELFAGKKWGCEWIDGPTKAKGTKTYIYNDQLSMKKISGKVSNSHCPNSKGTFTGKVKKGKVTGKMKQEKPCTPIWGGYTLYEKADNSYYMKGTYSYRWTDGKTYSGNATCKPVLN